MRINLIAISSASTGDHSPLLWLFAGMAASTRALSSPPTSLAPAKAAQPSLLEQCTSSGGAAMIVPICQGKR